MGEGNVKPSPASITIKPFFRSRKFWVSSTCKNFMVWTEWLERIQTRTWLMVNVILWSCLDKVPETMIWHFLLYIILSSKHDDQIYPFGGIKRLRVHAYGIIRNSNTYSLEMEHEFDYGYE